MGMALLKSIISAWAGQPFRAYKQDSKTFKDRVTTVKCTSLLKKWARYSRVISCSIRNTWTAWKLDVLPQLQIGQHLVELKMIEQKSFSQTVTLKLHSLLLRNSEACADGYFLKLRNLLKKHTLGRHKGNKTVFSSDSVWCIPCINPPLTGCVRDLCPRFWKAQLILTTLYKAGQRSQWKQSQNTIADRRGRRSLRDFGPSRDVPSAGAPWPSLNFQSETETFGFTPSVWRLCHTVFGFTRQGQLHKGLNCCLSYIQQLAVVYWSSFKKCSWERTCRAPLETPVSKHYLPAKPGSICEPQASH